jgi:hypothetical protein
LEIYKRKDVNNEMTREVDTKGYVKLYRKAMKDPIFKDSKAWHLFTYCLFNATFDSKYGEVGSFVTTMDQIKDDLGWKTRMTVDKFMKILKEGSYINYKTSNKDTTIYVPNYSKYQD